MVVHITQSRRSPGPCPAAGLRRGRFGGSPLWEMVSAALCLGQRRHNRWTRRALTADGGRQRQMWEDVSALGTTGARPRPGCIHDEPRRDAVGGDPVGIRSCDQHVKPTGQSGPERHRLHREGNVAASSAEAEDAGGGPEVHLRKERCGPEKPEPSVIGARHRWVGLGARSRRRTTVEGPPYRAAGSTRSPAAWPHGRLSASGSSKRAAETRNSTSPVRRNSTDPVNS